MWYIINSGLIKIISILTCQKWLLINIWRRLCDWKIKAHRRAYFVQYLKGSQVFKKSIKNVLFLYYTDRPPQKESHSQCQIFEGKGGGSGGCPPLFWVKEKNHRGKKSRQSKQPPPPSWRPEVWIHHWFNCHDRFSPGDCIYNNITTWITIIIH